MMTDEHQHALDALRAHVRAFLMEHLLTHTCDTESGERFPLVDKLCAPDDNTTGTGKAEITLLAEAIVDALPEGAAQAVRDGNLHAVMEAAAWRNAMTGLCQIWPKTADEAAAHLRQRLHPEHGAMRAPAGLRTRAAEGHAIDYTVVQAFADKHGVPYNEACAMVREALRHGASAPVAFIQRDHLEQAKRGAFLCRVESKYRDGMGLEPFFLGHAPVLATAAPAESSPDTALLDWLERQGTVNFDYETAQVAFPVPDSLRGGNSLREIVEAARLHHEQEEAK
ncbi:hypothetical protein [Cupriavidus sp. TMH.W2]|uniref:hypothetical protein n=1 Tax=Cupriavidus sp. TMH.W2 TaxID=3434465 RepID=UPI003D76B394